MDEDVSTAYNSMPSFRAKFFVLDSASGAGNTFFTSLGCNMGDSVIIMKYDENSGALIAFSRSTNNVGVKFNTFGWSPTWKEL